jgi:hypothetical protein
MTKQYKTLGDDIWKNKVEKIVSSPSFQSAIQSPTQSGSSKKRSVVETLVILSRQDKEGQLKGRLVLGTADQ